MEVAEHWAYRFNPFTPTKWIMPPTITFDGEEVRIERKSLFGVMSSDEVIQLDRVASVRLAKGIMTATVVVETMGGSVSDVSMKHLPKGAAEELVSNINQAI